MRVALLSPCPLCQAEPCCNTSRQPLARPQLKALPSEYFMDSHGPGARALLRAFAQIYRKKQADGEVLARGRPPAGAQLRWARCLSRGQENGRAARGAGWDGGMAAAGGRSDGAPGARDSLAPTHSPPQDVPPGIRVGMVSCIPMLVPVQQGREAPGASEVGGCCRGKGRECGPGALAPCIAPCLSFSSNAAERMLLGCAECMVRRARSWWAHVPGADPWHLWAQLQCTPSQLFPRVLGPRWGCWPIPGSPWVMGNGVPMSRRSHQPPPQSSAGDQHPLPPRPLHFPNMPVHAARLGPAAGAQL